MAMVAETGAGRDPAVKTGENVRACRSPPWYARRMPGMAAGSRKERGPPSGGPSPRNERALPAIVVLLDGDGAQVVVAALDGFEFTGWRETDSLRERGETQVGKERPSRSAHGKGSHRRPARSVRSLGGHVGRDPKRGHCGACRAHITRRRVWAVEWRVPTVHEGLGATRRQTMPRLAGSRSQAFRVRTSGFTIPTGRSPRSARMRFSAAMAPERSRASDVDPAACGVW